MKKNDGFTLIELLAVIAIMAVLAVAAITGYNSMARRSRERAYESKKQEIEDAAIKFAKETNLKNSTTISVNKLVAQGFLQPDSSSADGLAQVNNPLNHDNMICNLITITIEDDIYIAKYSEQNKDCDIAEQELADFQIGVSIFEWPETNNKLETSIPISGNTAAWTNKDIVLRVRSDVYTDFVSVSYDFDGQTITKPKNTPVDDNVYNEEDYNKLAIKDVQVMFNSEVTITYNMSDGSIHSRTIVVRVDKEVPTARAVVANDVTIGSTKKVKLYLDDANGSGVAGFYCSKDSSFPSGTPFIHDQSNKDSIEECAGSFAGYNSHFYGEQSTYYIKVVDKAGNELVTEPLAVSNFETADKSCQMKAHKTDETELNNAYEWYNTAVRVRGTTNQAIGTMGVKYFIGQLSAPPAENKLTKFFDGNTNNGVLTDYVDITSEKDLKKYYMGLQGLEKDKTIYHCLKSVGVDWHKPTVSVTCDSGDNCGTYKQKHTINITVQDDRSGFYSDANSIKVGWSTSSSTPPTQWTTITGGTISNYKNASNKTITDGKMTFTTDVNGYSSGSPLTGDYYIWVQGESIKDKAQNAADNTGGVLVRYDNTPPTCTNSGGSSSWLRTNVTIKGTCTDSHSRCKKGTDGTNYSYDNNGNVFKVYKSDIEVTNVSPGTVYDKAGNSTQCPSDRTIKIDTTKPTCTFDISGTKGDNGWYISDVNGVVDFDDNLSKVSQKGINSYDDRTSFSQTGDTTGVTYTCMVKDNAGNENSNSIKIKKDSTDPTCTISLSGTEGDNKWYVSDVSGTVTFADDMSKIDKKGINSYNNETSFKQTEDTKGTTYTCMVKDKAGNEYSHSEKIKKDTIAPYCTLKIGRVVGGKWISARGSAGWYGGEANGGQARIYMPSSGDVPAANGSYSSRRYRLIDMSEYDPTSWYDDDNPSVSHTFETNGTTYFGHVMDYAGNIGRCQITIKYDVCAPRCWFTLKDSENKERNAGETIKGNVSVKMHTGDTSQCTIHSDRHYYGMKPSTSSCQFFDPDKWGECYGNNSVTHTANGTVTYVGKVRDYGLNEGSCSITFTKTD